MSEQDQGTATIERDLAAVDEALRSRVAGHDDPVARELQELALTLQADVPEADPAFAEELRARVEAGFPPAAGSARARAQSAGTGVGERLRLFPRAARRAVPAIAITGTILVPLVLVATLAGPPGPGGNDDEVGGRGRLGGRPRECRRRRR